MILSLTVYTATALSMAGLGWHVAAREQHRIKQDGSQLPFLTWEVALAIIIYVLVAAFRWQTSWDYNQYLSYYMSMQSLGEYSRENYEPGFEFLTTLMAQSGLHFACFFAFWAALQITLLYYAMRHRKLLLPWVALCIMFGPYYMQWMSTIRQAVVECLFVVMVELIIRRKFWLYLLLTIVATSIHKLSILMLPLYLVPRIPVKNAKRWMPFVFLALCFALGAFPQWIKWIFDQMGQLAQTMGYGHYYRLFDSGVPGYVFRNNYGTTRLCPLLLGAFVIWHYPSLKWHYASTDPCLPALYRFALLYLGYVSLMGNTTPYLLRPGDLMRCTFLVMVCYLMSYLYHQRKWLTLAVVALPAFYYTYYEIFKAVVTPGSIYEPELYHTFLF